ncbi:MAG: RDD family protein [Cytophagaceae bacterium]|jgi:uncharacterized RDD family membrane protein YckC|nr:RDD family protein [Cytophagaceae bacterium]
METYNLSTSQNVTLQYRVASVGDRLLASILDNLIRFIAIFSIFLILMTAIGTDAVSAQPLFFLLLTPFIFYHFLFETLFNGQSPGKMILRIKVVKADGSQLTLGSCFIRWIFRLLDIGITSGMLAVIFIIINGKGQRLGDILASTTVLKLSKKRGLNDTIYVDIDDSYVPQFPQAEILTDRDVQIMKEVLNALRDNGYNEITTTLLKETRLAIAEKTGAKSDMSHQDFLVAIVKDYNAVNRV